MKTFEEFIKEQLAGDIQEVGENMAMSTYSFTGYKVMKLVDEWQKLNKHDVVRCKELLEQKYKEGIKADKGNDNELLALRIVVSLLEDTPAL